MKVTWQVIHPHRKKRNHFISSLKQSVDFQFLAEAYGHSRYTLELELQRRKKRSRSRRKAFAPGELVVSLTWYYFDIVLAESELTVGQFSVPFPIFVSMGHGLQAAFTPMYTNTCVWGRARRIFFLAIFVEAISSLARKERQWERERENGIWVLCGA